MQLSKLVAIRIYQLLEVRDWSLYGFSKKAGISRDTLKSIVKGKAKGVNLSTVVEIANGFNMTLSEFFDDPTFDSLRDENI